MSDYDKLARCNTCQTVIEQVHGVYYPLSGLPAPKCPCCPKGVLRAISIAYDAATAARDRESRLHPPASVRSYDAVMANDPSHEYRQRTELQRLLTGLAMISRRDDI